MSNSKALPPFTFDVLCFLNRDQLEHFSIVCRPLKNCIDRYFHSKPYRIFDYFRIRRGSYALIHNGLRWHPNRNDYSVQQFLAGQLRHGVHSVKYYSFAEMRPYLGPTVRIKLTTIYISGYSTYTPQQIKEMESIAYLWHNGDIYIKNSMNHDSSICAKDFPLILNSPTILQCRFLTMYNAHFSFKDYKVLYTVNIIEIRYDAEDEIDPNSWQQFLEEPGVKPVVVLCDLHRDSIDKLLDRLSKAFSSAVTPNAFKIVFAQLEEELAEFQKTNKTSREMLKLKEGLPIEYQPEDLESYDNYTLERSSI